ncbi:MAG: Histidine kinase [Promethearchaeota archaeon]|nr:MAG: Histidine kinase [Candidatus Lokiarchaeota archaeon]
MERGYSKIFKDPEMMNSFFDAVPVPCLILEKKEEDFILVAYNKALLTETKKNIKNIIGFKASKVFDGKKDILNTIDACYKEKSQKSLERYYEAYSYNNREFLEFTFEFVDPNFILIFIDSIQKRIEAQQQVKEERNKYRTLLYNLPIIVYSLLPDVDSTLEFVSSNIESWTGYAVEDFKENPKLIMEVIHPRDKHRVITEYAKAFKNKKSYDLEYRIVHKKTNQIRHVRDYAIPVINEENKIVNYNGIIIDISERKAAERKLKESERKLKESEEKFRKIADQSLLGIQIVQEGVLKYINKRARSFTGIEKEAMEDLDFSKALKMIYHKDRKKVKRTLLKRLKNASIPSYEFRIRNNGKIRWLESHSKKIEYDGKPADLIILHDITERKETEQTLEEAAYLFKNLAEQSSTGIQIIQDGIIKYVNKKWAEIFEVKPEDLEDKPAVVGAKFIHPEDIALVKKQMRLRKEQNPEAKGRYEFRGITNSGKVKWLDIYYKDITYQGKPASFVTIVDITKKKEVEKELVKLNKLKSEFLRRTSHELKTPLISIKGYADLLLELYEDQLPNKFLNIINEIKEGCIRLEDLIKDLLKGSRLESGKVKLKPTQEDLSFLIKFTVRELKYIAKKRNQGIHMDLHQKMITYFEKERIYEVLKNLISNAIKYTPENGKIFIKSEIRNDFYIISIRDTGIGFTEEEKELVFTQFGKVERYGQGFDLGIDGTGLGLYIAKKVIELHGGAIWMESEGRNMGSTFYFSLPIIE